MHSVFAEYLVFLLEVVTVTVAIGALIALAAAVFSRRRGSPSGKFRIHKLNERFENMANAIGDASLTASGRKAAHKRRAKELKRIDKDRDRSTAAAERKRVFVIDFKGDIRASRVRSMREEVTAVVGAAQAGDEVVVRVESGGGAVSGYGLAASQLERIRAAGIKLTITIDKVAASGGYMMAVVADRIVAAPFSVVGSIGVITGVPNLRRYMRERGVDYEQVTAGKYKRTLTVLGENTEEGRAKLQAELNDIHAVFKELIARFRPHLDLERVATGEWWLGARAKDMGLVDELGTSDDVLLSMAKEADVFELKWEAPRSIPGRIAGGAETVVGRLADAWTTALTADHRW